MNRFKNWADFDNFCQIWNPIFFEAIFQNICKFFTVTVYKLFHFRDWYAI